MGLCFGIWFLIIGILFLKQTHNNLNTNNMSNITAAEVNRLRTTTGAGMMDCKKSTC